MKPFPLKTIFYVSGYCLLFIVIAGFFFYYQNDILSIFKQVHWSLICLLVLLHLPSLALGGLAFKILCKPYQIHLRWQDWVGLSFIANFLNQLFAFRPGIGFRYYYLHQHYQIKTTTFGLISLQYFLSMLLISAFFSLMSWQLSSLPENFNIVPVIALAIFATVGILMAYFTKKSNLFHFALASLALGMSQFVGAIIFYFTCVAANVSLPFIHCIFLSNVMVLGMIFPITPGNIGLLETLIGSLTQMLYNDFSLGFSVVALYRTSQLMASALSGMAFSWLLVGKTIPSFKKVSNGFTLIELMIVVAIIGILASIAIPAYNDYVVRSRAADVISVGDTAKTSVAEYRISKGIMPTSNTTAGVTSIVTKMVSAIAVGAGGIITITGNTTNLGTGGAFAIILTPTYSNGAVQWTCTSSGTTQYAPASCR